VARYRWFESISLQQRVFCEPDFSIIASRGSPRVSVSGDRLARHPDVDLVTVTVKVPDHYRPVMAAIDASKHIYCEWPLGRNTGEAREMLDAAERKGVRRRSRRRRSRAIPNLSISCYTKPVLSFDRPGDESNRSPHIPQPGCNFG